MSGLTITNGNLEGAQYYTSGQTNASSRDFFFRALHATNGDGWYNSNNAQNWDKIAGEPTGSGNYAAKDASANRRGVVNVTTDSRQTKGVVTVNGKVLFRANSGTENFIVKVWGVRENTPGQWDGWIDLTGPTGNADGLDLRNFNNALAPDNAGQSQSGATPVTYTGTDFTLLLSRNAAAMSLTPSDSWQNISFNFDLGTIGYDKVIIGFAFQDTSGTRSGVDDLTAVAAPPAEFHVTNGGFEGGQFVVSPQVGASARDFIYRGLYAANGDGWFTSNNTENWDSIAGGAGGTAHYGAKDNSANNRGIVNIITDNRQTKGMKTLYGNVLYRASGGTENLRIKVWGVREGAAGQWDGWIDLSGPTGNNDGLDLRNYNNTLAPDAAGQTQSAGADTYTGSDFTPLLSTTASALGLTPSDSWQPFSFSFDLGATGYDQVVVGFSYGTTSGIRSGIDDLGTAPVLPLNPDLTATPAVLPPGQNNISLTWTSANSAPGATYVITTNKAGYGPYEVTAQTTAGASTSALVVPYNPADGDVTFTLTANDTAAGRSYTDSTTVLIARSQPVLVSDPPQLSPSDHQISLTWSTTTLPANYQVVITSNRVGIGPFPVTGTTNAAGSSTTPLVIPYLQAIGDVTFTITVTDLDTGVAGSSDLVVKGPGSALPNVLMVLVDDMGWADTSPYGGEIQTPTIQRLADHGLRFREFHNEARCAPTRNALMSGLHVQTSATDPNNELPPMRIDNNVTIAEMLRSVGYRTYHSGKWHLSEYVNQANYTPLSSPTHRGFDYAYNASLWGGNLADHHGLGLYWDEPQFTLYPPASEITPIRYDGTDGRATMPYYKTDADTDYAIEYLNHHFAKGDDKPFFIYLAYNAPHFYLQSPKDRINRYTDVGDANPADTDIYRYEDGWDLTRQRRYERQLAQGVLPPGTRLSPASPNPGGAGIPAWDSLTQVEKDDLSRRMAVYASMVQGIDMNLARIIARLEQQGQLDNTIIMFMSDNGGNAEGGIMGGGTRKTGTALTEMGQSGQDLMQLGGGWAGVNNTPFRYFKHHTFEGGCRTPFIVHWPAGIGSGQQGKWTDERGHAIDIMPTLLEKTGIRYPQQFAGHAVKPLQGTSLLPAWQGLKLPERDLMIEHERNRALYRGDWKLVTKTFTYGAIEELPADTPELYNLRNDPTEMNNLAFYKPPMLTSMVNSFNSWVDSNDGLAVNRKLTTVTAETDVFVMPRGKELFSDGFNRADADDLDAAQGGVAGTLIGMSQQPLNDLYFEGYNPAGGRVSGKRLRFTGMVENGVKVNLNDPSVLASGGFSVSMDIKSLALSPASADHYVGFGVGLTQADAALGGDVAGVSPFRGNNTQQQGKADLFAEYDGNGDLKIWVHGILQATVPAGAATGKLLGVFETTGAFSAGSIVHARIFFKDSPVWSGSFPFRQGGASFVGLSANSGNFAEIDNLVLSPLPLRDSFVGSYAQSFGLGDSQSGPDEDPDGDGLTNIEEWMTGGNPAVADTPLRGAVELRKDNTLGMQVLHRRAKGFEAAGVSYGIRCSSNLTTWFDLTPAQISVVSEAGQYEKIAITLPEELRTAPKLFFVMGLNH